MVLGAGLCGIGASLLWASEAAIAVGYPEEAKRGKYVGIWMGIRQLGPLIGGSISLALNVNTAHRGKVSYNTYLGLIAISALGAPCALLLSQPAKVIRSDGSRVPHLRTTSFAIEAKAIWRQLMSPYLLLLIPAFLAGQFGVTYQSNYLTSTCDVWESLRLPSLTHSSIRLFHSPSPRARLLSHSHRWCSCRPDYRDVTGSAYRPVHKVSGRIRGDCDRHHSMLDMERNRAGQPVQPSDDTELRHRSDWLGRISFCRLHDVSILV